MPPKDQRPQPLGSSPEPGTSLKAIERFLRLLVWQIAFLLVILAYLIIRPQAGRYQFTVAGGEVLVFDTANSQAMAIKLQRQDTPPGSQAPPPDAPAAEK